MGDKEKIANTENNDNRWTREQILHVYEILDERKSQNQLKKDQIIVYASMAGAGFCAAGAKIVAWHDWFACLYIAVGVVFAATVLCAVASFRKSEQNLTAIQEKIDGHIRNGESDFDLQGETKNPYNHWAFWLFVAAFVALIIVFVWDFLFIMEENNAKK